MEQTNIQLEDNIKIIMENKNKGEVKELTLEERKASVKQNFEKVASDIKRLSLIAEQLKGQFALLEELTKKKKTEDEK